MRRIFWSGMLVTALVVCLALPVFAGSLPLDVQPTSLELKGAPSAALSANLRLSVLEDKLILVAGASEFTCLDDNNQLLPAMSASRVGFAPAFVEKMAAGSSTQVAVTFNLPEKTGICTGELYFDLGSPIEYRARVPVRLVIATTPVLALQSPEKMTVNGWNRSTVFSQPFTLKETANGSPITDLKAVAGTFSNAEWKTLPEGEIVKPILGVVVLGGQTISGSVEFNLVNVPAGMYEGQVLFKSGEKLLASLPVTLNVRHDRWPAVLVLALGVGLGLWLSFYKEKGRARDLLIKQIAEVKRKMNADPQLDDYFGPCVNPLIREAEILLEQKKYTEGTAKITVAEQSVTKWVVYDRLEWIAQLDYLKDNLIPRLEAETSTFGGKLRDRAKVDLRKAADQSTPAALQEEIKEIEDLLASWKTFLARLDQISSVIQHLPSGPDKDNYQQEEKALRIRHDDLPLDVKQQVWGILDNDIQKLLQKVINYSNNVLKTPLASLLGLSWNISPVVFASVPPARQFHTPVTEKQAKAAQSRLTFWTVFTYGLGGALLAIAGYNTLCLPNLIFGAHPVVDYAGLFMWGLTGQAGFTAIADLVRGFGFPVFLKG
jgi:hypothetical protein